MTPYLNFILKRNPSYKPMSLQRTRWPHWELYCISSVSVPLCYHTPAPPHPPLPPHNQTSLLGTVNPAPYHQVLHWRLFYLIPYLSCYMPQLLVKLWNLSVIDLVIYFGVSNSTLIHWPVLTNTYANTNVLTNGVSNIYLPILNTYHERMNEEIWGRT